MNQIRLLHVVCALSTAVVWIGCGDSSNADASTSASTESTTQTQESGESGSESSDESSSESDTETGEPDACDMCTQDELCVAQVGPECGEPISYSVSCQPMVPECEDSACAQACTDIVCDGAFCVPECELGTGVDLWCGGPTRCSLLDQDCPEGEKCVPSSSDGVELDDSKCVAIIGDAAIGETCTWGGLVEATDDCGGDGVCHAPMDPLMGTCRGLCDTSLPDPCTAPDSCQAIFAGMVAPDLANAGLCRP